MSRRNGLVVSWLAIGAMALVSCGSVRDPSPGPYTLDNGLTVVLRHLPGADQVAVALLFNIGNAHDPPGMSGQAHLVEHLYGTSATATSAVRDAFQLQHRYDGMFNMQTGPDYTVIAGVVDANDLDGELDDIASRMTSLRLTEADLQREVPRMLAELAHMYGGMPSLAAVNHIRADLHPAPGGGRYGGAADHVQKMELEEIRQLWHDHYRPNNAILVVAGGLDPTETRDLIEQKLGPIPAGKSIPPRQPQIEVPKGTVKRIALSPPVANAAAVAAIGYAPPPPGSKEYAPFLVLVARLWSDPANPFRPGKVPPVFYPPLDDPTTFALQTELTPGDRAEDALDRLDQRLRAAMTAKLANGENRRTANAMAMLGTADLPDAMWQANLYGLAFSVGRRLQLGIDGTRLRAAIERVTDIELRQLATTVFAPDQRVEVIIELPE